MHVFDSILLNCMQDMYWALTHALYRSHIILLSRHLLYQRSIYWCLHSATFLSVPLRTC
jgi:hypothetical protein